MVEMVQAVWLSLPGVTNHDLQFQFAWNLGKVEASKLKSQGAHAVGTAAI